VPVTGGQQMYQALRSLNVPTELIVYPGQFHGFYPAQLYSRPLPAGILIGTDQVSDGEMKMECHSVVSSDLSF